MIQQQLVRMNSLLPIIERLDAGYFETPNEINIHLYLLSDLSIGFDDERKSYIEPLELEKRVDLLLRYAEFSLSRDEYESCEPYAKRVREKAEDVLLQFMTNIRHSYDRKIDALSLETIGRICVFYSKVEHLTRHKKQLGNLSEFFQMLYYWHNNPQSMPNWLNSETEGNLRRFLVSPIIAVSIMHASDISLAYILICGLLSYISEDILLKDIDNYARGIFRINNPLKELAGPTHRSTRSYDYIAGQETIYSCPSSFLVVRAAQVAHMIKSKLKK
jgi:hypothetical protein